MSWNNRWKLREIDLLAGAAIVAIAVLGVMVRRTLSPDGVSYLDLAAALRQGDVDRFIQGYWSPLYPALLAIIGGATGQSANDLVTLAHIVNVVAVAAAIVVIWRWSRAMTTPWFGRAAIAALIVCSAEPPRVEALTPDLILLLITTCIGYEIVVHAGRRWVWVGILFGLAYLTKTSTWPWILVAMAVRLIAAPGRASRALAAQSDLITIALALLWILPMSLVAGQMTLGSTARLNYRWYLESSDARTPDTHRGEHAQYQEVPLADSTQHIRVASFDTTAHWTYQPWSDPEGWSFGIKTHRATIPSVGRVLSYWLDTIWQTLSLWLRALILAVLLPAFWIGRRKGVWRELTVAPRSALVVISLGLLGMAQYIAVHAEPRLIAPFVLLSALGALHWLLADREGAEVVPVTPDRFALSLLGLLAAVYLTGRRIDSAHDDDRRIAVGVEQLVAVNAAAFAPTGETATGFGGAVTSRAPANPRVAVIGPVLPVLANIYWTGGRIVAQVPPMSVATLRNLPVEQRSALLHQLFSQRADALWITASDGSYNIVRVP
jgi:hypothetical protein